MEGFCDEIRAQIELQSKPKQKLKGAAIVLNYCNMIDAKIYIDHIDKLEKSIRELLTEDVEDRIGIGGNTVEIFRCALILGMKLPDGSASQHKDALNYMSEQLS